MNVLSIGNSFSEDAQRYLHYVAKSAGVGLNCFNLYIGGCSLSRHFRNMMSGERAYTLHMNGESTMLSVSLDDLLLNRDWDVITLQQASPDSPFYDRYQPYLDRLAAYVRERVPKARIVIHQTWAYEDGSNRITSLGFSSRAEMFAAVKDSYAKAAEAISADAVIPSGELLEELLRCGVTNLHRDGFHLSYGIGRYAVGMLWYHVLTGRSVADLCYSTLDVAITEREREIAKECIAKVAKTY